MFYVIEGSRVSILNALSMEFIVNKLLGMEKKISLIILQRLRNNPCYPPIAGYE